MRDAHGAALGCVLVLLAGLPVPAARRVSEPPLVFTIAAPATVRLGDSVLITLRLENTADRPVEAHFLGRTITFDIIVTAEDGTVVWRRLDRAAVPSILQVRMLGAGEVLEWQDVWRPAARGRYRIQGILPSDAPEPLRTPAIGLAVA